MENLGWDLETIDNQNYFDLLELFGNKNKPKPQIGLADFLKRGGIQSIKEVRTHG